MGSPLMGVYCASKWAIEGFSHGLRRELKPYGVNVVVVRPCKFLTLKSINYILCKYKMEASEPK